MTFSISAITDSAKYISNVIKGNPSPFMNRGMSEIDPGQQILFIIILILLTYLTMWFGTFVYNTSVVNISSSLKPLSTLDFFGLYIVIHLLFC